MSADTKPVRPSQMPDCDAAAIAERRGYLDGLAGARDEADCPYRRGSGHLSVLWCSHWLNGCHAGYQRRQTLIALGAEPDAGCL